MVSIFPNHHRMSQNDKEKTFRTSAQPENPQPTGAISERAETGKRLSLQQLFRPSPRHQRHPNCKMPGLFPCGIAFQQKPVMSPLMEDRLGYFGT